MHTTDKTEKIFLDPIHREIRVEHKVILDLINAKEMQRLRRIKQLGTTHHIFHGAVHNRFAHCLGVYDIARRMCDRLSRHYPSQFPGDGLWDDERERLVVLCAALLHDIGHGAFSHTFEKLFHTDHEAITQQIILDSATEVNHILRHVRDDFPQQVASVIDHTYPNPQVVQLISSQCDADRMDYLLRDSYFTGTNYGMFDLNRILRVMRPCANGIIFNEAGMHAVEDYIVSRYQMYMQVYFHPVTRAMETILGCLLERVKARYPLNPNYFKQTSPFIVPFITGEWTLTDYLRLDDGVLEAYFSQWLATSDDSILCDLADRYLNRRPFKSVTVTCADDPLIDELKEHIEALGYDTTYYTAVNTNYDLPYDFYRPTSDKPRTQIELLKRDGTLIELSDASRLIHALAGEQTGDARLYFPSELVDKYSDVNVNLFDDHLRAIQRMTRNGQLQAK